MASKRIYKVVFHSHGKVYELHARNVSQGELFGFVEVSDILFGERSSVLVDPSEEKLKAEFAGVSRTYVPLHAIVRIDEVEREGANKITALESDGKVTPFPVPVYSPSGEPKPPT